jgi:hypothetical protein
MSYTYTQRFRCTENFVSTLPDKPDVGIYDRWHVLEKGKLAEKWLIVEKGQKSFVAEITSYIEDENV